MTTDDFANVKKAVRLSEYISRHTISPPRAVGTDKFMAFCPLHDNTNTEAMSIDDRMGLWKCFAECGGGSIIDFYMKLNGTDSIGDALRGVATDLNVKLPEQDRKESNEIPLSAIKKALKAVAEAAHDHLMEEGGSDAADAAYEYLKHDRELSEDVMERWMIGVLPSGREATKLIRKAVGSNIAAAIEGSILAKSKNDDSLYSPFHGRILFPLFDKKGDVIGFGGRQIPGIKSAGEGKYINPTNNRVYSKANALYGAHQLKPTVKSVVVVEGYLDVIAVSESGAGTGVACCGTALTAGHAEMLSGYPRVTALFDSDKAGQLALGKAISLSNHLHDSAYGTSLPAGLDPWDAFLADDGSLAYAIDSAEPIIDAATKSRFETSESMQEFDTWVATTLSGIDSGAERDALLRVAAKLRSRPVGSYGSTVGTISLRSYSSSPEDATRVAALDDMTISLTRRLFQLSEDERQAVTASFAQWDKDVDDSVAYLLPASSDFDIDVVARVIAPGADINPEIDQVLATLMPHPDDEIEDMSIILRNGINATLASINLDHDQWVSQILAGQAMSLRRALRHIEEVDRQPIMLAALIDATLDACLSA